MEQVTIGQVGLALTFIVGLLTSIKYLKGNLKEWVAGAVKEQMDDLGGKVERMEARIAEVDIEGCKNFLVSRIAEVERGTPLSEFEKQRFMEQYDHYQKAGGNSYIKDKVERLKADGKI